MTTHEDKAVSRRDFIRSTARTALATGAALYVLGPEVVAQIEEGKPFRFGLIGAGGQGRVALMSNAMRIPGVSFTAICDIRQDHLDAAVKQAGGQAKAFRDYRELLAQARDDVDAVIIATPLFWHERMTVDALKAGLHVFCEKTMAQDLEQCRNMLRARQEADKVLQIGHHLRYHPLYHHAKRTFIDNGLLGTITTVNAHWNRNGSWRRGKLPEAAGLTAEELKKWGYDDPDRLANWRLYKELSGGLMTELASHQTDVVNWFLDSAPVAATGVGGIDFYKDGRTVYDNVHVTFEYPGGVKFAYESLTTSAFSVFGEQVEVFRGTQGTLALSNVPHPRGWFFQEAGALKEVWMDAAEKIQVGDWEPRKQQREAIVLDATVTEGPPLAGIPISQLITKEGRLVKQTYEIELMEFIYACQNNRVPRCDGVVGMHSAVPAIIGNQAMATQKREELPADAFQF